MIDTLVILFSTSAVLFVVIRAVRLDRKIPWFETEPSKVSQPKVK